LNQVPFKFVTIVPDSNLLGCVQGYRLARKLKDELEFGDPTKPRVKHKIEAHIMIYLAGQIAEHKFTGRRNVGSWSDDEKLTSLAFAISGEPDECSAYISWLYKRCKNWLCFEVNWRAVEALAHALLATPKFRQKTAIEIMETAMYGEARIAMGQASGAFSVPRIQSTTDAD
jgi:hypothetical protein